MPKVAEVVLFCGWSGSLVLHPGREIFIWIWIKLTCTLSVHLLQLSTQSQLWCSVVTLVCFVLIETNQQIVKGLTHCLLPECSNPTWPFENYCGRTHANIGKQRGLIRTSVSCVYPHFLNLTSPLWRERKKLIKLFCFLSAPLPSVDTSSPQQSKDSSLCIFPNCNRPKFVDGATIHPYCGRTHAQQGKQLGIVREL